MVQHLKEYPPRKLHECEAKCAFFDEALPGLGSPVRTFHGGYFFRVRFEEKILPPSVVNRELEDEVKRQELEFGRKLLRREKGEEDQCCEPDA